MLDKNYTNYLTSKQINEVKKAFEIFDQDNSGSISIRQFDQILKSLGQNLREQELENIVQTIDRDQNGLIDFDEFLYLVAPKIINNRSQKSYIEAFRAIDVKNQGFFGINELQTANKVTSAGLSQEQLIEIMQYVQERFKGKLNLQTVLTMLQRLPDKNFDQ